jgi:hypothetical protein
VSLATVFAEAVNLEGKDPFLARADVVQLDVPYLDSFPARLASMLLA